MNPIKTLAELEVGNVFPFKIENPVIFDLSREVDLEQLFHSLKEKVGIGKYNEKRTIYQSDLFSTDDRSIHLGMDLWVKEQTPILAILDSKVHSFQDNNKEGDYGPTIILEHEEQGLKFYTLYGHLTRDSLKLKAGQLIKKGEPLAKVGSKEENGNWPPHLHFQIILDLEGRAGDFPGVTNASNKEKYLKICPDPNLLLRT